ncbi:threonine-phosphate decarboxylase [Anaerotruncus sp. AF02-27]|uniref:threonine-phosphate decarboxylase CobD n=1 Tax=Anaerotruncus TaxID=244127 RepID=UPI000E48F639|nr:MULTISPECIES: threonine-phosphate decarboxylase CobD [Anaerotruncus]RGX55987.1 threonine-phosphate decarboxylase [Anaerotruncus sp. AF02-27]
MTELIHGGDIYGHEKELLDFSANLSPLGLPESVRAALSSSIGSFAQYPDPLCRELTAALSKAEKVPPAWILCGNGAADLIFRTVQAVKPRRAVVTAPAFAEYERALRAAGCEVVFHPLSEKADFCLDETLLDTIGSSVDLLFLCNPNNPTGQTVERGLLLRILQRCRECGTRLLLDECFVPFLDDPEAFTLTGALGEFPNLLILKAFTKLYAMAGLRLGYLLCSDETLNESAAACGQPWNVSVPAQVAGVAALADTQYVKRTRALVKSERERMRARLGELGLTVIGSRANYLFFRYDGPADLRERLLEWDILIRSCENFQGLDRRYCRAAVKLPGQNDRLLEALKMILQREAAHG